MPGYVPIGAVECELYVAAVETSTINHSALRDQLLRDVCVVSPSSSSSPASAAHRRRVLVLFVADN